MKKYLIIPILFISTILLTSDVMAKGGSSGGGRSSSSSSSRSSSSSHKSSSTPKSTPSKSWGDSKPSTSKPSTSDSKGWGNTSSQPKSITPKTTKTPTTPADKARQTQFIESKTKYDSAQKSGKVFQSRDQAVNKWKTENAGKFENKFTTPPAKKPDYIPNTYSSPTGYSAPISYNQQYGGYGYMDALGTFILWDAMTDIAFQNNHMNQSGYYVGNAPKEPIFVQPEERFPWGTFVIGVLMVLVIGIGGLFFVFGFGKLF